MERKHCDICKRETIWEDDRCFECGYGEYEYGVMISNEIEMGVHTIPFRIQRCPAPTEESIYSQLGVRNKEVEKC